MKQHIYSCFERKRKRSDSVLSPTTTEMSKGQSDNTNNATKKFDYTAVGVTTATQLVWLTWFTGHSPQRPCNQKDTRLKMCK